MSNINFKHAYNREEFLRFLNGGVESFLPDDFRLENEVLDYSGNCTKQATRLGICPSLGLDVIEIIHTSTQDARVGLSKEAFRLLLERSKFNRALILFIPKDNPSTYRFSLVNIDIVLDDNKVRRSYSNPRRYSFLLGEEAKIYTPTQYLILKGRVKDLEDLQKRFSVEVLTKEFYAELSDWYSWTISEVKFPNEPVNATKEEKVEHNSKNVIRLLTRLLFVWFLKQKHLIPNEFFDTTYLKEKLLKDFDPYLQIGIFAQKELDSRYYKAILQNLFFAMLNCPIAPQSKDDTRERGFRKSNSYGQHRDANYLMRYKSLFKDPVRFLELANKTVPFLNGGLFDCLDIKSAQPAEYIDGFSDNLVAPHKLIVPDYLFFGEEKGKNIDLSWFYGGDSKKKTVNIRGLINILETYNFTIEENTPYDQEVSLDPELLGKVFENLLASYNPETKTTARKQTGSFYTPREIVQYMVDESLIAHLKITVGEEFEDEYRKLMRYTDEDLNLLETQKDEIVKSLFSCKVIDPACGSGAFPVGMLQQMVHILSQLDPDNKRWKEIQKQEALSETSEALDEDDEMTRTDALNEIELNFNRNLSRPDYARKLYLIENSIYGVDIQPIAVQISKLRFFISLVVEQKATQDNNDNFGIRPLPNLEAKFVSANTLISLEKQYSISETDEVRTEQDHLKRIRRKIFSAKDPVRKRKLKIEDKETRNRIAELLKKTGYIQAASAEKMAKWDPYDQNASASFFNSKWMFGMDYGFDIVIGNPPYLKEGRVSKSVFNGLRESPYYQGKMDLWYLFACCGIDMLSNNGHLCFIATNNWVTNGGASKIRNKVISDTKIIQLVDFGNFMIFESASIQTMVMMFEKNNVEDNYTFDYRKLGGDTNINDVMDLLKRNKNNRAEYLSPTISRNNFKNSFLTFSSNEIILSKISANGIFLTDKEVANGIHPHYDFVNNKIAQAHNLKKGEGIFGLSEREKQNLNLSERELCLVKPYYTTEQVQRYYTNPQNTLWLIYTDSRFKNLNSMNSYPQLKNHLDRFAGVITSDNKPYGLHRAREEKFFKGEKIIALRKCVGRPSFSYSDFDCYVSATFYVIKTSRINQKYLLGLLNSRLIEFWLRNKGKMQGDNFQLDKEPLLGIPIANPDKNIQSVIANCIDYILLLKDKNVSDISALVSNRFIANYFEEIIDGCIYELYFEEHMKDSEINILEEVSKRVIPISNLNAIQEKSQIVVEVFNGIKKTDNPIRTRLELFSLRSPEFLRTIIEKKNYASN